MTNEEAFERLFDISIKQLMEMPQKEMMEWKKETNRILWGGFNGGNISTGYQALTTIPFPEPSKQGEKNERFD